MIQYVSNHSVFIVVKILFPLSLSTLTLVQATILKTFSITNKVIILLVSGLICEQSTWPSLT